MAKASFRWLRIIGILLFIWIIFQIDWFMVWKLLKEIRLIYVLGYFIVFVVAVLLKVFRLRWFLYRLGYHVAFNDVYQCVIEPAFYGMVTPARIGEFTKVLHLTRFGLSTRLAWGVVLMERLVDFSVLLITSVTGIFFFIIFSDTNKNFALGVFLALLVVLYICLMNIRVLDRLGSRVMGLLPGKHSALANLSSLGEGLSRLGRLSATIVLPISVVVLLLSFLQLSILGFALNANISGIYLGLAYAFSTLMALLPISFGGLGTREAIYVVTLGKVGVSVNMAVTISLLDGLVFSLLFLAVLFVPVLIFRQTFSKSKNIGENENHKRIR